VALLTRAPLDLPVAEAPRQGVARAGQTLEELGHHVESVDFELFPLEALASFLPIMNSGFGDYSDVDFTKLEPHNLASYAAGQAVDSISFVRGLGELQRISRRIMARWGREFDLLVTPTLTIEPPRAGTILEQAHANPTQMPNDVLAMGAFTAPFNLSGQPAMSLPLHQSDSGLPVGVQLVGGPFQEALMLRVAAQLEQADPWIGRRPPLDT
jgi:amidase